MYADYSTTAEQGALDWKGSFQEAVALMFEKPCERESSPAMRHESPFR
jgi:hypothetical protein